MKSDVGDKDEQGGGGGERREVDRTTTGSTISVPEINQRNFAGGSAMKEDDDGDIGGLEDGVSDEDGRHCAQSLTSISPPQSNRVIAGQPLVGSLPVTIVVVLPRTSITTMVESSSFAPPFISHILWLISAEKDGSL
uniref:Uncharacterized protein n=1 Tax=Oryza nivara TaxID=4536 RepID=A0A0E0I5F1_ORYNI